MTSTQAPLTNNAYLSKLDVDIFYHLGLDSSHASLFSDVRFVLMCGSPTRALAIANRVLLETECTLPVGSKLTPVGKTERYVLYKIGPILTCSHGIGMPSILLLLHEVTKLLDRAKVRRQDVTYIRVGTCGGIGVKPGTQVITRRGVNGELQAQHHAVVLGEKRSYSTELDASVAEELLACGGEGVECLVGDTMSTDDFYEGQGRVDGALCEHSEDDKLAFLRRAHERGVRNIEMESAVFAAFCNRLKLRAACICAVIVNRMNGDQVTSTHGQLVQFSADTITVVLRYVRKSLGMAEQHKHISAHIVLSDAPGDRKESKRSSGGAAAAPSAGSGSGSSSGSGGSGSAAAGSGAASESKQASASGGGCRRHRCGHHGCPCHDRSLLRTGLIAIGATVAVCKILKWTGIIPSRCHKGAAGGTCPVPHGKPAS